MATREELAKAALERLAAQKAQLNAEVAPEVSDVVPQQADTVPMSEELIDESEVPALQDDIVDPDVAKAVAKSSPKVEIPTISKAQPTTLVPATIAALNNIPVTVAAPVQTLPPSTAIPAQSSVPDIAMVKQVVPEMPEGTRFVGGQLVSPIPAETPEQRDARLRGVIAQKMIERGGSLQKALDTTGLEGPQRPSPLLPPEQQERRPSPLIPEGAEPTVTQVQQEFKKQIEPIQQAKAQVSAAQKIKEQLALEQERKQKQDEQVQTQLKKEDQEVRARSLDEIMQKGSFLERLGTIIAIGIGGASRVYTGSKTNPVLDMIDRAVEQQAAKDKLKRQEKDALKEAAYKEAMLKLEQAKQATNDFKAKKDFEIAQRQLDQSAQSIALKRLEEAQQRELVQGLYSGKPLSPEQQIQLTEKQREKVVYLPDIPGFPKRRQVLLNSEPEKKEFDTDAKATSVIQKSVDKLENIQKNLGFFDRFSPAVRAEIEAIRLPLSAALRIPYTGTGPLTEAEREMLAKASANPASFYDAFVGIILDSPEKAKLDAMRGQVYLMLQESAKAKGITVPVVPVKMYNDKGVVKTEKQLLTEYKTANPNVPESVLLAKIRKMEPHE